MQGLLFVIIKIASWTDEARRNNIFMLHVRIEPRKAKKAKSGFVYRYIIPANKDYGIEKDIKKGTYRTKKEAMEAGQEHLHRIMNGEKPDARKITLDDVWQEYLELNPAKVKPQTISNYTCVYNTHIKKHLGSSLIRSLDYKKLQKFFNGVKPSRASEIKKVINILMTLAVRLGYIAFSPTREIVLPKVPEEEKKIREEYISDQKLFEILDQIKLEKYRRMIWIGYYMGLRYGEALGLDWKDIDMEAGKAFIHQQLLKDSTISQSLKTSSSKAVVPIAPALLEMMKEWKKDGCPHILHEENGKRIRYKTPQAYFRRAVQSDFHFHALRHTFITNLIQAGISPKTVMKLARHSSIEMTLQFYTEVTEEMLEDAVSRVFPNPPQKEEKEDK